MPSLSFTTQDFEMEQKVSVLLVNIWYSFSNPAFFAMYKKILKCVFHKKGQFIIKVVEKE